ncbi:MAG: FAD-dependent oxidoreductase [Desulfobacterales bacterium]
MSERQAYDVVILGTGPAGLQAAIHAARKKVSVLVLGRESKSSLFHAHVENFCCLFEIKGDEMLRLGRQQAKNFGTHFRSEDVLSIQSQDGHFILEMEGGDRIDALSIIIATGTHRTRLGVKGEKEFLGKGVSYCVDCDGNFFRGEKVAVVGDESAAVDGALTLAEIADEVHLISKEIKAAEPLKARLQASSVVVHTGAQVDVIHGEQQVGGLSLKDGTRLPLSGVFIELGAKGLMQLAGFLGVQLDADLKYIAVDRRQATNLPGIYAAGDICGPPWQMAKAVGEGCVAGIEAANHAKKVTRQT